MANIINLTPVYDRSRVVQDWKCPRSRYWNYEYRGLGISPSTTALELFTGITIHDALAAIALTHKSGNPISIDELAATVRAQMFTGLTESDPQNPLVIDFAHEQAALAEGMIRGYYRHIWPKLLASYPTILFAEEEMHYDHDSLRFMSKPDLIMQSPEGETVYVEFKSTASKKDEWVNSWQTAVQLHSTVKAVEASHGIKVDSVVVLGLYKGYHSYGRQNSVFCYAHHRKGNPPFTKDETSYIYKAGYKKIPTWTMEGGVKKWVEEMPEEVLTDQFLQTLPIYINEQLVDSFFVQRAIRERQINDALSLDPLPKEKLDEVFPQRFDQCVPSFGKSCPYQRLCHGHVSDPLQEGFSWREPHHEPEKLRLQTMLSEQK